MRTVKTFRKLGQDEEGHSTSFETHKYPGDLGTVDPQGPGCGGSRGGGEETGLKFQPPVPCHLSLKGCLAAGTLYRSWASTAPPL